MKGVLQHVPSFCTWAVLSTALYSVRLCVSPQQRLLWETRYLGWQEGEARFQYLLTSGGISALWDMILQIRTTRAKICNFTGSQSAWLIDLNHCMHPLSLRRGRGRGVISWCLEILNIFKEESTESTFPTFRCTAFSRNQEISKEFQKCLTKERFIWKDILH